MAAGWQAWKRVVRRPVGMKLFNGIHFRAYPDCGCSSAAFYFRIPNSLHMTFFRSQINGGTLLDVGANVGLASMLLADKVQHAVLFEPNPAAATRARENIKTNGLQFEVHEVALSDATGNILFEDMGGVDTCNRIVDSSATSARTVTVPRTTADTFLARYGSFREPITAVKIDVEGHENSVLRGMREMLRTHRPRIVMFEYLQRTNLKETFDIFGSVDYRIIVLSSRGEPSFATPDVAPLQDLFACPCQQACMNT